MEQQTGSKLGKEYVKAVCCHPAYLIYMQNTSWETLGLRKYKLESRLLGEISITSDMQMTPPLWQKAKEELKTLLMKVKEDSEKAGLKLNIQKIEIMDGIWSYCLMANRWETMETVTDFILGGSKITVDSDCCHEIQRLLGRKAMTNLDRVLKNRDIILLTKVQSYGFSSSHVWMWELDHKEGWALKNWCFWIVVLEKTLGSPLDCKEIKPI